METHNLEQITLEIDEKIENLRKMTTELLNLAEKIKSLSDDLNFQLNQIYNLLYTLETELKEDER